MVTDMNGESDSSNVALSAETSIIFELSNVNDEAPRIEPLQTQVATGERNCC